MKLPRVLAEKKRGIREKPPPPNERSRPHFWLGEERRKEVQGMLTKSGLLPLYMSRTAEAKMRNHSISCGGKNKEAMGLLMGDVHVHSNTQYTLVKDVVTTSLNTSEVSVSFEREGFGLLFDRLDEVDFDYLIVGWYHSHLGYGCFMSPKDVETQRKMFREKFHYAVVLDPMKLQIEAFTLSGSNCVPAPFAVYWEEFEDPYGKMKRLTFKPK